MAAPKPPSGRTIVNELQAEMEERLYPLLYRTLPPGVYHVYLHPDDFREIEHIVPLIVADAREGLTARVSELNRRPVWATLMPNSSHAPLELPAAGWDIGIHADPNGEIERGQFGIESRLSVPPPPSFEGGTPTARIARTIVTGAARRPQPTGNEAPAIAAVAGPPPAASTATAAAAPSPDAPSPDATVTALHPASSEPQPAARIAQLQYVDDTGPHRFVMRKDRISIGRGGSAHWVDVQVVASPRVSREHCRIRRTTDGRYFLQDVSSWGTSVDGAIVAPFVKQEDGRLEETGVEHQLPARARIQLADAVVIEFSVEP